MTTPQIRTLFGTGLVSVGVVTRAEGSVTSALPCLRKGVTSYPLWPDLTPGFAEGDVQRINIGFWYQLGARIRPLAGLQWTEPGGTAYPLAWAAREILSAALESPLVPLVTSHTPAVKLLEEINALLDTYQAAQQAEALVAPMVNVLSVSNAAKEFETVFFAELLIADAYFVSPKGGYSTPVLIGRAEDLFIGDRTVLTERGMKEIREWGRCFAFELPTASGFHIMRATELAIVEYLRLLGGPLLEERSWKVYIDAVKRAGGDEKVKIALHQIKNLHRNPLMHPDDVLSMAEADALFGLAKAAIIAMAADLAHRAAAADVPPTAPSPLAE